MTIHLTAAEKVALREKYGNAPIVDGVFRAVLAERKRCVEESEIGSMEDAPSHWTDAHKEGYTQACKDIATAIAGTKEKGEGDGE